jgi:hypothetical protein
MGGSLPFEWLDVMSTVEMLEGRSKRFLQNGAGLVPTNPPRDRHIEVSIHLELR